MQTQFSKRILTASAAVLCGFLGGPTDGLLYQERAIRAWHTAGGGAAFDHQVILRLFRNDEQISGRFNAGLRRFDLSRLR